MALSIMTNPTALVGQSAINRANNSLLKTIGQLSTGLRINSSADDASGLAVADKLAGQISGLAVASRNAQDGLSYLQTAEAAMGTMTSMVQRIRELAVQAGDPAYTTNDRVVLQAEVDQLIEGIDGVSSSAEFNTNKLLSVDSSMLHVMIAAIGANEGQSLNLSIGRLDTQTLNLSGATVLSFDDSQSTITKTDQSIEHIATLRAVVGAKMNRLNFTITNLDASMENMLIAESRIRDLDIAEASTRLAGEQILLQSASAMLAQANQLPLYAAQLLI